MEIMHRLDIRRKFMYKTKTPVSVILVELTNKGMNLVDGSRV